MWASWDWGKEWTISASGLRTFGKPQYVEILCYILNDHRDMAGCDVVKSCHGVVEVILRGVCLVRFCARMIHTCTFNMVHPS
jgi:hypothetical protein